MWRTWYILWYPIIGSPGPQLLYRSILERWVNYLYLLVLYWLLNSKYNELWTALTLIDWILNSLKPRYVHQIWTFQITQPGLLTCSTKNKPSQCPNQEKHNFKLFPKCLPNYSPKTLQKSLCQNTELQMSKLKMQKHFSKYIF